MVAEWWHGLQCWRGSVSGGSSMYVSTQDSVTFHNTPLTRSKDAFAGVVMFSTAWVGDKYHIRGPIIAANAAMTILGLAMMGWAPGVAAQYTGVFFTCAGANSNIPHMMSWQANNIRGQWKRAFCSATLVAFGGIGGIAGSLVFRYLSHRYITRPLLTTIADNKTRQNTDPVCGHAWLAPSLSLPLSS